jgi:hypothetical protein
VIDFLEPHPGASDAVIHLMFVLSDHGRATHTVVLLLTPRSTQSGILGSSIHSDGWEIDVRDREVDRW